MMKATTPAEAIYEEKSLQFAKWLTGHLGQVNCSGGLEIRLLIASSRSRLRNDPIAHGEASASSDRSAPAQFGFLSSPSLEAHG